MENIIVSSFKRNDSYDYEVDIKASDYEPAAASEYYGKTTQQVELKVFYDESPGTGRYFLMFEEDSWVVENFTLKNINDDEVLFDIEETPQGGGAYRYISMHDGTNEEQFYDINNNLITIKFARNIYGDYSAYIEDGSEINSIIFNAIKINGNEIIGDNVKILQDQRFKLYGKITNGDTVDLNGFFIVKCKKISYSTNDYKLTVTGFDIDGSIIPLYDSNSDDILDYYKGTTSRRYSKCDLILETIYEDGNNDPVYINFDIDEDGIIYLSNTIQTGYDDQNKYYPIAMLDNMVLHLKNNYNDDNGLEQSQSWWYDLGFDTEHVIKQGTILKVTNREIVPTRSAPHYGDEVYDSTYPFLPAYIIAKEDYTITGNGYDDYLNIGLPVDWGDEDAPYGKIDTQIKISDSNIWESCTPSDPYARSKPWSFVTEGIVTDYISFQWNDKYNEPGTFTLALVATQENMDLFKEDRYIMISSSDRVMMIENVEFNVNLKADGYIMTVSGRSLEAILERRAIFPGQGLSTNEYKGPDGLCKALYDLVDGFFMNPEKVASISSDGQKAFYYPERRVPFLKLPADRDSLIKRVFHQSINLTVSKDDVLKIVQEQCKQTDLGFKIIPKKRYGSSKCIEWEFCLYTGKDKSYGRSDTSNPLMIFSPTIGNVEAISTVKDSKNYRNVIFCGVEKESDGYINLMMDVNDANYWGQKTGVELVDSINSNATNLISGVKNSLVTKLEASPVCYTGILFLALAAMRNDCDYQPTVNMITKNDPHSLLYIPDNFVKIYPNGEERDLGPDNPFYMIAYKNFDENQNEYMDKIFIQACMITEDGKESIYIKPSGENIDRLYFNWGYGYPITCDIEYFYINGEAYGKIIILGLNEDKIFLGTERNIQNALGGTQNNFLPLYSYQDDSDAGISYDLEHRIWTTTSGNIAAWIQIQYVANDTSIEYINSYPSKYINYEEAKHIYITYRRAYGDNETIYSGNKTGVFRLSAVNPAACVKDEDDTDFKTSTAHGWLTTPILKQAITDLNNTQFSGVSILKKSAIQAWFKTLDKYTDSKNQMRWLCQEHVQNSSMVGLDRREVFVEEDNSDDTDWNASKINQWQQNTKVIAVDQNKDEKTDEQINERLLKTARKKSGEYRRTRDIDASLDLTEYDYDSSGESTSPGTYTLGDIIQIDDGYGNLEKYLINGVTQSMDTTSGPKIVPSFEKYELIPKQYHRLEWLQVANMILPAKFNPMCELVSSSNELSLPSNVYFGAMAKDRDQAIERQQNDELGGITSITYERLMKISDIEMNAKYVKKETTSGEPQPELKNSFAMISALGSYRIYDDRAEMNIPMAMIYSKYRSPLMFMSQIKNTPSENDKYIPGFYMGNRVIESGGFYEYKLGCGYRNYFSNPSYYSIEEINEGSRSIFELNKLESGNSERSVYDHEIVENKLMYFSKSTIRDPNYVPIPGGFDGNYLLSDRPLSRSYYDGKKKDKNNIYYSYIVDESISSLERVENSSGIFYNDYYTYNEYEHNNDYRPGYNGSYSNCMITANDSYWGQDNYIWSKFNGDRYQRYEYENNFVVGGCGYIVYNNEKNQYYIRFDGETSDDVDIPKMSPRSCDTENGVTLYNLKIYETDAALRSINFKNVTKNFILGDKYNLSNLKDDNQQRYSIDCEISPHDGDNFQSGKIYIGFSNGTLILYDHYPDVHIPGSSDWAINVRFNWTVESLGYPLTCTNFENSDTLRSVNFWPENGQYLCRNIEIFDNTYNRVAAIVDIMVPNSSYLSGVLHLYEGDEFDAEIPAYYPALNTRVLAHEYVPVVYVDAEKDTPNEEKYGLYDITEQTFVPVNFGSNSAGTFIAAGGEIIDQE